MNTIKVTRLYPTPAGLFGVISLNNDPVCWSLEPPWRMNKINESCVIPGVYLYKHYLSPKFKRMCISLSDVYNRSYVSIHQGNLLEDTNGCILVGMSIGHLKGHRAVKESNKALDLLITNTTQVGQIVIESRE